MNIIVKNVNVPTVYIKKPVSTVIVISVKTGICNVGHVTDTMKIKKIIKEIKS